MKMYLYRDHTLVASGDRNDEIVAHWLATPGHTVLFQYPNGATELVGDKRTPGCRPDLRHPFPRTRHAGDAR